MKITTTSLLIGIAAIGAVVFVAFYLKRKRKKETPATTEVPPVAQPVPPPVTQNLMRAVRPNLQRTPVGYMMN